MKKNLALVLSHSFDPNMGGVQQSTSKLATIFKQNGHDIFIVAITKKKSGKEMWNNIRVYSSGVQKNLSTFLEEVFSMNPVDVVINQSGYDIPLTFLLKKILHKKVKLFCTMRINPLNFVENHKTYIHEFLKKKKLLFLNKKITRKIVLLFHYWKQNKDFLKILKTVDAMVLLSESFKEEVFELSPKAKLYSNKMFGIPNPFKTIGFQPKENAKQNVILFVGRLNIVQKRVDLLMNIWNKLHDQLPNWEFWIVGHGEEEEKMKEFSINKNLNRVRFFGKNQPDLFYEKAKILHFTSAFEGFGNVLIEAQRYGCVPILFNSYSAAKDIIKDSENGFLIPPFDESFFIKRTLQLANEPSQLKLMAENSIINSRRYSYEKIYSLWEGLFMKIN